MELKNIKLRKGMTKTQVNTLIGEWVLLDDEVFNGNKFKHNWKCLCGNIIESRIWDNIRIKQSTACRQCRDSGCEDEYRAFVNKVADYRYIKKFKTNDKLPSGKISKQPYIQIKHIYCGTEYIVKPNDFKNKRYRCSHCCKKYENSFAYHIEVELGLDINDVWDFEKNTVNPYHIYKNMNKPKVWIKCQEKDYHGSYEISCNYFVNGNRCVYCASKIIHPLDSFGQYLKSNDLLHLWSVKNTVNPFEIARSMNNPKIWMLCDEMDYHNDNGGYEISCGHFVSGRKCSYCGVHKVHPLDSFGAKYPNKVKCWHEDNDKSPFEVKPSSGKRYKFTCDICGHIWNPILSNISKGTWCLKCNNSKGEKRIEVWLENNNITYIHNEPYFNDLLSDKRNPLRPDFISPKEKIWIEYDGEFHYKDMYKDGSYEILKRHDKRKDEYAKLHGWKLIRIPYWEFDNIESILEQEYLSKAN